MAGDLLAGVRERAHANLFWRHLGIEVVDAKEGWVRLRVPVRDELRNAANAPVHGGVYSALVDTAVGGALSTMHEASAGGVGQTTLDLNVSFIAGTTGSEVFAEGRILRRGRTIAFGEATVTDARRSAACRRPCDLHDLDREVTARLGLVSVTGTTPEEIAPEARLPGGSAREEGRAPSGVYSVRRLRTRPRATEGREVPGRPLRPEPTRGLCERLRDGGRQPRPELLVELVRALQGTRSTRPVHGERGLQAWPGAMVETVELDGARGLAHSRSASRGRRPCRGSARRST